MASGTSSLTWPYLRHLQGCLGAWPRSCICSAALWSLPLKPHSYPAPARTMAPCLVPPKPDLNAVPCPAWHMWGKWGGCHMLNHHPPRWHGALPSPARPPPLTSACPLPPAKTRPPSTACSLSCSPQFVVCGFLSAGPTPPRPTPPRSRPAPALPRPLEEWQENPGDPGAEGFPRLAAGPPVRAVGNGAQGRQLVQGICKLGLSLQDYEESHVILELPSPTLQTATHTDVQC